MHLTVESSLQVPEAHRHPGAGSPSSPVRQRRPGMPQSTVSGSLRRCSIGIAMEVLCGSTVLQTDAQAS